MVSEFQINEAYLAGREIYPAVSLSLTSFGSMALERGVDPGNLKTYAGDFYLACSAADGTPEALDIVERRFMSRLPGRIRRLGWTPDKVSDVLQVVRERLFAGSSPRIRAYNAAAPLEQWVKVVAIRTAIDLHRQEASIPRAEGQWLETLTETRTCPEDLLAKHEYRAEFEKAIRGELSTLSLRDRTVLKFHVVEGLSIEEIAVRYGVHRVTVARWVWNAGESVLEGLRRHFQTQFGIAPSDFDSLAQLVRSQLTLDLAAALTG